MGSGARSVAPDRRPPPAFQFYASDLLAQWQFTDAKLAERGLLLTMMARYWVDGALPADMTSLARRLGLPTEVVKPSFGRLIQERFVQDPSDATRLIAPLLDLQKRQHEERTARMAEGGRKGGRATQQRIRDGQSKDPLRHPSSQASMQVKASEMRGGESNRVETSFASDVGDEGLTVDDEWMSDYDSGR